MGSMQPAANSGPEDLLQHYRSRPAGGWSLADVTGFIRHRDASLDLLLALISDRPEAAVLIAAEPWALRLQPIREALLRARLDQGGAARVRHALREQEQHRIRALAESDPFSAMRRMEADPEMMDTVLYAQLMDSALNEAPGRVARDLVSGARRPPVCMDPRTLYYEAVLRMASTGQVDWPIRSEWWGAMPREYSHALLAGPHGGDVLRVLLGVEVIRRSPEWRVLLLATGLRSVAESLGPLAAEEAHLFFRSALDRDPEAALYVLERYPGLAANVNGAERRRLLQSSDRTTRQRAIVAVREPAQGRGPEQTANARPAQRRSGTV
jgi:hypothetical protein